MDVEKPDLNGEPWFLHKVVAEIFVKDSYRSVGYKLSCGEAMRKGLWVSLGADADCRFIPKYKKSKKDKHLCPICFPNEIEQE